MHERIKIWIFRIFTNIFIYILNRCHVGTQQLPRQMPTYIEKKHYHVGKKGFFFGKKVFIEKRLQHRCFPVKLVKFLRTPFSTEHHRWLLLNKLRSLWFIVWRSDTLVNLLTKSSFGISLLFKLKYSAILLLTYIVDCE